VARHEKEPDGPGELSKRSWGAALKRTFKQFNRDNLTDWAAALTYYGVLSLFPGIIVLTAILGLLGPDKIQTVIDNVNQVVPGQGKDILVGAIKELTGSRSLAGPLAILGLLGALWSASGYIGAFMRASNAIYGMPEGRPLWKVLPLRVALTVGIVVLLALCALGAGCGHSNRSTSDWMKSVNSIKPGNTMDAVRHKLGRPDSKRTGETPLRPHPPAGSPQGVLSTLPSETRYEQWIYKRGDSHYHVFFARTTTEPRKWEVIAVRSSPATEVY